MHRQTLELREKVLGLEHPSTLDSMNNLALVLDSQGKYEEAETIRRSNIRDSLVEDGEDTSEDDKTVSSTIPLEFRRKPASLPSNPPAPNPKPAHLSLSLRRVPPMKPLKPPCLNGAHFQVDSS